MVVHGDDFIVAGCGDVFHWVSQKHGKLELVQKARFNPRYDSDATMLNRCATYNDSGLTWESDPRHAELAVAELGFEAARPQTSPGGAKPSTPLDHEELEPEGQKACHRVSPRLAHLTADRLDIAFACKECSRAVGKATRADLTRLNRSAVWEFPLQTEQSIVTIDGLSDAAAASCLKTRRLASGGCLRVCQHTLATLSSTQKVVSPSSTESEYCSMVRCTSEAGWSTLYESWDTRPTFEFGQLLQQHVGWLAMKHMEKTYFWLQQKEKNQEFGIDKICVAVNPADLMTKHLDGKRLVMMCDLLNIKRIGGRPSSAPKLTMDTECISHAS